VREVWEGIKTCIRAGKWGLAARIAWAGVKVATLKTAQQFLRLLDSARHFALRVFHKE
jgi:hypothetical protein